MDIKSWLDYLYYGVGKQKYDFYLQYSEKDKINTRWKKYSEVCFDCEDPKNNWLLKHINQRQIFPIEVVLDLEEKQQLGPVIKKLREFDIIFYVFATGSRGFHVHLFFKRELSKEEKLQIINYFGADTQKASKKCLIALEFSKHWKSGQLKQEVQLNEGN
jgi:DNA primase catalytic subunit